MWKLASTRLRTDKRGRGNYDHCPVKELRGCRHHQERKKNENVEEVGAKGVPPQ